MEKGMGGLERASSPLCVNGASARSAIVPMVARYAPSAQTTLPPNCRKQGRPRFWRADNGPATGLLGCGVEECWGGRSGRQKSFWRQFGPKLSFTSGCIKGWGEEMGRGTTLPHQFELPVFPPPLIAKDAPPRCKNE